MDRKFFFDAVREPLFGGALSQDQVEGCNALLDATEGWTDRRWRAYLLATAYHETAHTMQPVAEYGKGRGRKYGVADPATGLVYYGRGHVQLTWYNNYKRMGDILGVPLVQRPEMALQPEISAQIIRVGMERGSFTGHSLEDYFNASKDDPRGARRIVNGTDRAELIAGYHRIFLDALPEGPPAGDGDTDRVAALEARVAALEARLGRVAEVLA